MKRPKQHHWLLTLVLLALALTACPGPTTNPAQWDTSNFDQANWQ